MFQVVGLIIGRSDVFLLKYATGKVIWTLRFARDVIEKMHRITGNLKCIEERKWNNEVHRISETEKTTVHIEYRLTCSINGQSICD